MGQRCISKAKYTEERPVYKKKAVVILGLTNLIYFMCNFPFTY